MEAYGHRLVAFERGPVVYCVEDVDRKAPEVAPAVELISATAKPDLLGGVMVLTAKDPDFLAIPYFAWNNRGLAPMAVWLKRER